MIFFRRGPSDPSPEPTVGPRLSLAATPGDNCEVGEADPLPLCPRRKPVGLHTGPLIFRLAEGHPTGPSILPQLSGCAALAAPLAPLPPPDPAATSSRLSSSASSADLTALRSALPALSTFHPLSPPPSSGPALPTGAGPPAAWGRYIMELVDSSQAARDHSLHTFLFASHGFSFDGRASNPAHSMPFSFRVVTSSR